MLAAGCFNPNPPGMDTEDSTGPGLTSSGPGGTSLEPESSTGPDPVDPDSSSSGGSSSSSTDGGSQTTTMPPGCAKDEIECAGECFDPLTDPAHCGDCDTECSATEACMDGSCVSTCREGEIGCGDVCIDPLTDPNHCGAGPDCEAMPGVTCAMADVCVGGMCLSPDDCFGFVAGSMDADIIASAPTLQTTRMAIAWDGASLWTSSGGGSTGIRLAEHDGTGMMLADYAPGLDLRSVFTQGDGTFPLYARVLNDLTIRVQIAPGSFVDHVTLVGGTLDSQASVAWDPVNDRFIAHSVGVVDRWDPAGNYVDSVTLMGYGLGNELMYPQNRGVAFGQGCILTLDDGMLSAWNDSGDRVDTIMLNQAVPGEFNQNFSVSFALGRAWHGTSPDWHGYDVFGAAP